MYYSCQKPSIQDKQMKHQRLSNPSFSSILLDEIFHSIDGNEQNPNGIKHVRNQTSRRPNNVVDYVKIKTKTKTEPEEIACKKRAWLVEKKVNQKVSSLQEFDNLRSLQDNDPMFFSTSSSSCSESSSGGLSSSDADIFYNSSTTKSRNITSCFSSSKPNKASASAAAAAKFPPRPRQSNHQDSSNYKQSECYIFDDFSQNQYIGGNENEDNLMKFKSRAMKMYNDLKKVKQPISPGARLTSFITSFFASGNAKKSKDEVKYVRKGGKPSSTNASTCSSASSFSRSCMSKSVSNSKGKFDEIPYRKTVHFCPVNVVVDGDSRPSDDEFDIFKKQPGSYETKSYPTNYSRLFEYDKHGSYRSSQTLKTHVLDRNKRIDQEAARDVLLKAQKDEDHNDDYEEEEDVDGVSDCSSDLFEINHLEVFGNTRFCEELPVYETTHLDRNRAIPIGLKV